MAPVIACHTILMSVYDAQEREIRQTGMAEIFYWLDNPGKVNLHETLGESFVK